MRFLLNLLCSAIILTGTILVQNPVQASEINTITLNIWYRERVALPPDAELRVYLEDVARMDVPAERIASKTLSAKGGPPWQIPLEYDASKLHDRGRYGIRVRIEAGGRLLFINTEHIPAFGGEAGETVDIRVSHVAGTPDRDEAETPDAGLTNTYWKLIRMESRPVTLGAGQREVHMVLVDETKQARGFSGCNRFTGSYEQSGDQLRFLEMASTMMACIEGLELEQHFLKALISAVRFAQQGNYLTIYNENGNPLLNFVAVYLK